MRSSYTERSSTNQEMTPGKIVMIIIGVVIGIIMGIAKANTGGHYEGGSGSSHEGGHYVNYATDNHYTRR